MADIAKAVGGDYVEVEAITNGQVDLHFFEPRPGHIVKLQKADLLVVGGMEIDVWIQSLIEASRNPRIRFGERGYVDPSDGIKPLDVPVGKIDGSLGDVHPYGNPHYWFTLNNARKATENIFEGLSRVDKEHLDYYAERKQDYIKRLEATFARLKTKMKPFAGTKVVQFHKSWDYFCAEFGLEIVGELEPKPGIPPSPAHLKALVERMRQEQVKLMLAEPYYARQPIEFVERQTSVKALRLSLYLGGNKAASTYLENLEYNVDRIAEGLGR
jgi:ABC-type Zn uptake system ZnuABC Zn-binding protein ZnuA